MDQTGIFFVQTKAPEVRMLLCHWVEHYVESGKKVQVPADSTMAAKHLDQMLWSFSESSFIPHRVISATPNFRFIEPVIVTVGEIFLDGFDLLVCDSACSLEFMSRYPFAVHFILDDDRDQVQDSRVLWQSAKDLGLRIQHVPYASNRKFPDLA